MLPFDIPENTRKPLVFWCFKEAQKGTLRRKRLTGICTLPCNFTKLNPIHSLTCFMLLFPFYTPWKHQKTTDLLFSSGIESDLTLMVKLKWFNPSCPNPERREKIILHFYFHTSLWCLKRFYEGLKGLHKTFWGTTKLKTNYAHLNQDSVNLVDMVRPTGPGSQVLSRRSYHQWWSMGATLVVDDPELAPVLSGTHLPTSKGWKVGLAARGGRKIWWYDLHGESNPCRSHGSTMVYSLCYSRQEEVWK